MINYFIKLKTYLSKQDVVDITELVERCDKFDPVALKLELEYKTADILESSEPLMELNEFMYYDDKRLVGYLGIGSFGGSTPELNGMVDPEYRNKGIFGELMRLAEDECRRRRMSSMLLLSDRKSTAGQAFIISRCASFHHTEFEMHISSLENEVPPTGIFLRKATNSDADEVARQNKIYFDGSDEEHNMIMPETEEKRGMTIYIAEYDGNVVGKTHLQVIGNEGSIFGLGILPEYRGLGLGRKLLLESIRQLSELNASSIMLQVESENSNALNLYKSCGFEETSVMDYYKLEL
ncbi:MAG: GNAT family N-acetyltransferase [Clostridiales bacterium]|nr:GNAT family N-acetyltransferase [Clostridiales bacterium]